jgi:putative nucleotidyltransferase with HDIG domain
MLEGSPGAAPEPIPPEAHVPGDSNHGQARLGDDRVLALPGAEPWHASAEGQESRAARILIVDDDPSNVRLLIRSLHRVGYTEVQGTTEPLQAFHLYTSYSPDLVLLDLHMPGVDGMSLLEQMRSATSPLEFLPILIVTGDVRAEPRREALAWGATDFLTKPFDPLEIVLRVNNILATRALHLMLRSQNARLEQRVAARTRELEQAQLEGLERLALAAEFRDDATGRHTVRVASLAAALAQVLDLPAAKVDLIRKAAPLHDIGKIGIPDQVLLKPAALSSEELQVMQTHATIGARILGGGRSALMQLAERIARSHHERWDGSGYPDGLAGETIPIEARVTTVADAFDALTHARPYRPAWSTDRARQEIAANEGRHYDPQVVGAFLSLPDRLEPGAEPR